MHGQVEVRLGKSGLHVTKIGFGGIPIQRLSEEETVRLVRHALSGGLNWIDTANAYGTSEQRLGKAIKAFDRSSLFLFTKGTARDPDGLRRQIELSLKRLQTETIDLYQFHLVPSREMWNTMMENGTFEVVREYRDQGVIRHIGASAHARDAALSVIEHPEIEVLQYPFNFIVEAEGLEIIEACRRRDVGFIAMKPFGGGALHDASACIRFLLGIADIAADPGFEKIEEVDEVLDLWKEGLSLSSADRRTIERLRSELGTRFCRRCGYCSPCPQGVNIIQLMTMDTLVRRFPKESLPAGWIAEAARSVDNCIECGECEPKCPYELPIIEGIRRGAEVYREALQAAI